MTDINALCVCGGETHAAFLRRGKWYFTCGRVKCNLIVVPNYKWTTLMGVRDREHGE